MNKLVYFVMVLNLVVCFTALAKQGETEPFNTTLQVKLEQYPFPEDISGKPSRFTFLRKLLEVSSGAKKVLGSDNIESHNAYIAARKTYLLAAQEPDNDKVNSLLDKTVKLMYEAIRKASSKQLLDRKKERDYKRKLLSVKALLEALERIAVEKKNIEDTNKLKTNILEIITVADDLIKKHNVDKARELLDEAYLLTKTGIENMRSGDVLVRELTFEFIEEEYAYELDRNDTHQMLVKLLIEKKLASKTDSYKKKINDRVKKAKTIRKQAENFASNEDYSKAISELEKSTKELVRAIRMGGVFIPG
ncbi:hypothetical protein [Thalassotalea sp. G2M2-11]|uniref:hypothetical protein n=1 Tax=Thalassotalea sp. G2M2-11 TaxID=2787627 RepID=UPI0019D12C52|nr:hypothetical protein [Thalassotalea sp. G2M2-11]